jgi:hypothetical protein
MAAISRLGRAVSVVDGEGVRDGLGLGVDVWDGVGLAVMEDVWEGLGVIDGVGLGVLEGVGVILGVGVCVGAVLSENETELRV